MWKLLSTCLLVSCAVVACATDNQQPVSGTSNGSQGSVVQQVMLPLETTDSNPERKTFRGQGMQGWLDQAGDWQFRGEVQHQRLRCATYQTGIQFGRGNPACDEVEWLTDVEPGPRLQHCNRAIRIHSGEGNITDTANPVAQVSCVRITVRCEGAC